MYALETASVATPIGLVVVEGNRSTVLRIRLLSHGPAREAEMAPVREAAAQIAAYFAGRLTSFDLPLAAAATARGGVLRQAITDLGFGATASYGALATTIGSSARAIGQACARNPFPIVVPCHRVLQAGGQLGPYSAGEGPTTKRWLLAFEGAMLR